MLRNSFPVFRMKFGFEPGSDQILAFPVEIPAIRIIDKDMCALREETADKFGLVLDNITVPLLTFLQSFLSLLAFGDIRSDTYKELVSRSIRVQGLFYKNDKGLPGSIDICLFIDTSPPCPEDLLVFCREISAISFSGKSS